MGCQNVMYSAVRNVQGCSNAARLRCRRITWYSRGEASAHPCMVDNGMANTDDLTT